MVASWLVGWSPDRAVRVRALAGDTVLCSWARHFTLTAPFSTQKYKWVPAICWENLTNYWGVTCDGLASRPCHGNRDKLWPDEPDGSKASLWLKEGKCLLECNYSTDQIKIQSSWLLS